MGTDRALEKLAQQILEDMSYIRQHSSKTSELLATGVTNSILDVATDVFPTAGAIALSWAATCGAIEVSNHGDYPVFVSASANSGTATPRMPRVDPGTVRVINVASRNVTLYGTAGETVGWQASTRGGIFSNSLLAVDGGVL